MTYEHGGRQYVAVLSGVGGWAGIGLAAGLLRPENAGAWHTAVDQGKMPTADKAVDTAGLGAVGGYAALAKYTSLGGSLTVFVLPQIRDCVRRIVERAGAPHDRGASAFVLSWEPQSTPSCIDMTLVSLAQQG